MSNMYFQSVGVKFCVVVVVEQLLQVVGVIIVYVVKMVQVVGFKVVYLLGGGVVVNLFGIFDFGISMMEDVLIDVNWIINVIDLLLLVDIDMGWGGVFNIVCMVCLFINVGVVVVYFEDQVGQKCCGYCFGKEVVLIDEMVDCVKVVVDVCIDDQFVIMVCIDVVVVEGIDLVIECVVVYVEVGVDMIFLEVMKMFDDYCCFKVVVKVLIFVNLIEFGLMLLFIVDELCEVNVDIVLYCCGVYCVMNKVVLNFYEMLCCDGMQKVVVLMMQMCVELYDFFGYYEYECKFDELFVQGKK